MAPGAVLNGDATTTPTDEDIPQPALAQPTSVDDMLCFAAYSAARATAQAYRSLLAPWNLTYPQYLLLIVLWRGEELSVSDIAAELRLDSGTLSPLIRRMESAGFVTKARSAGDERVVTVGLTAAGAALRAELAHIPGCIASGVALDAESAAALLGTLHELTEGMRNTSESARA